MGAARAVVVAAARPRTMAAVLLARRGTVYLPAPPAAPAASAAPDPLVAAGVVLLEADLLEADLLERGVFLSASVRAGSDPGLVQVPRFGPVPRLLRRPILAALGRLGPGNVVEDLGRHRLLWIHAAERLHPVEHAWADDSPARS